jgi:hypothetical protein
MIRFYNFNLKDVAYTLHRLGVTNHDIGMASMLSDNQRFDLIKHLEDLRREENDER